MRQRGLTGWAALATALAAGATVAVPVAALTGVGPAAAHDAGAPPGLSALARESDDGYLAQDVDTKDCAGIPGGARPAVDGWVFARPVAGAVLKIYGFLLAADANRVVEVRIDDAGIRGIDIADTKSLLDDVQRNPIQADQAETGADIRLAALPPGVAGGLIPDGGAWLQTPAGWRVVDGALNHGNVYDSPAEFGLVRTCILGATSAPTTPPPEPVVVFPSDTATPEASARNAQTGGGSGPTLALLAGAGILLVGGAAGAVLVRVRRRRSGHFRS